MLKTLGSRWLLSVFALSFAVSPALAARPGGGGTTLPPVRYQIQYWTVPGAFAFGEVLDANDAGQAVGSMQVDLNGDGTTDSWRGILYDPNVNAELGVDLNTIVSGIPAGWAIRKATAINEVGQIAAYIEPIASPNSLLQPVMIDMTQNPPVVHVIPDGSFTSYSVPWDINAWGDIAVQYRRSDGAIGSYVYNFDPAAGITEPLDLGVTNPSFQPLRINNLRDIVGNYGNEDAFRLRWGGSIQVFTGLRPQGLNEGGVFCGVARVSKVKWQACVYDTALQIYSGYAAADDLNDSKDFVGGPYLYLQGYGRYAVRALLDPNDPDTAAVQSDSQLIPFAISNRAPNFPVMTGVDSVVGMGVRLTPVPAP